MRAPAPARTEGRMTIDTTERKKQLRDAFIESRGYWNEFWDALLDLDEDFFEAYTQFSSVPWRSGPLDPKIKELVYIAVDAAATLGIHACTVGVPILVEELEAVGKPVSRELSARQEEIKAEFADKRGYWN